MLYALHDGTVGEEHVAAIVADAAPPSADAALDQLVADAVSRNPALKAQELQVSAAESNVSSARGGHYPTLSLGLLGR